MKKSSRVLGQMGDVTLIKLPPDPRKQYPLWRIDALEKDIASARRNIETFSLHIQDQEKLIAEREEQIALCRERDEAVKEWEKEMARLGQET